MLPSKDDPPPVRGCQYAIGCALLLFLAFLATFPWSGFLLQEVLKTWGIRM